MNLIKEGEQLEGVPVAIRPAIAISDYPTPEPLLPR
jgi:hypothetical protein